MRLDRLALLGAGLWLVLWPLPIARPVLDGLIERILLLALLVVVPLALSLVDSLPRLTARALPLALLTAAASLFVAPPLGGWLVLPWLALAGVLAAHGMLRLLDHAERGTRGIARGAGLLFVPVGAGWLLLARLGVAPLDFGALITALTAVHFHYAGLALPLVCAGLVRDGARSDRLIATGIVLGIPIVATGITLSRTIEFAGVVILTASVVALAARATIGAERPRADAVARALLWLFALLSVVTMGAALLYAIGLRSERISVTIPQMVRLHGWGNAAAMISALLALRRVA